MALAGFDASAGNQEMMDAMAQELIQINESLLKDLGAHKTDGRYDVSIRVVERDGKRVIKIDEFSKQPQAGQDASEVYVNYGDYSTFIRYGPIPQTEEFTPSKPSGAANSEPEYKAKGFHQRLNALADDYKGVRVLPLDAGSVQRLSREQGIRPGGGAVLLYW